MKFTISSETLEEYNFSMLQFSILLYYLSGGTGVLHNEICEELWNRGYLIKTEDGFIINNNKLSEIDNWFRLSSIKKENKDSLIDLAKKMRDLFPDGKKPGTYYYWKDSVSTIAARLTKFFEKYGDNFTEDQILDATKRYVESFNGNYKFMHLLKYFISKRNTETKEETSELLSFIENADQENNINDNWLMEIK